MSYKIIDVEKIGEKYMKIDHSSGLTIFLCPMQGFSSTYAQFSTRYGSLDTTFRTDKNSDFLNVPEGIAHFLEHKMFEDEDGDAFAKFSKTGASANASTSFDRTVYEFLCSDNFLENLEILIKMVTSPYFTDKSVEKEQGIIAQEINMYNDNPSWRVYFNLLKALYHNHPITIDIAGTVESISNINKELLYDCYNTFYNLNNMVLSIAGNFEAEQVIELCDKLLVKSPEINIEHKLIEEPQTIKEKFVSLTKPISMPMFEIGFKADPFDSKDKVKNMVANNIMLEILAGECSPLFTRLYDSGKITDAFDYNGISNKGMFCNVFSGESNNPQEVLDELVSEIKMLQQNSIDVKDFERTKKFYHGKLIMGFNNVESIASAMTGAFIQNRPAFEVVDILANITIDDINNALKNNLDYNRIAMSVANPN